MKCPNCYKEISDTAVRCKYCKWHVAGDVKEGRDRGGFFKKLKRYFLFIASYNKNSRSCSWTLWDVLIFMLLMGLFIFNDPFHIAENVLKFLRLHFFIFTKEPRLLYYLTVYISTIIFKCISLIFLFTLIKFRKVAFWSSVVSSGKFLTWRGIWLPLYIIACVLLCMVSRLNPLVPDIPFNSVFPEAQIMGNMVIIFSVLVIAPFVEEILFRGFLYPALNRYMGVYPAVILTTVLFTLAHYPQIKEDYVFMLIIVILGLMITYAKAKTASTRLAILMHHIYNLVFVGLGSVNYIMLKIT